MADTNLIYSLRMNTKLTADERIQRYLEACQFKTTVLKEYDIVKEKEQHKVKYDEEIRPLDKEHVKLLLKRLEKGYNVASTKYLQSPIICFKKKDTVWILDGKHRLEALRLYYKNKKITTEKIQLSYVIESPLNLQQKIILVSMASEEFRDNNKPLTKTEIMRNARVLLKECPGVLGLSTLPDNSREGYKEEKKCQNIIIDFFHVYPSSLVLRNIWKVIRISDNDSKEIFDLFELLPSGFTVNDYDLVFNKYPHSPEKVMELLRTLKDKPSPKIKNFHEKLKNLPEEFTALLKDYGAFDVGLGEDAHISFIASEKNDDVRKTNRTNEILTEYISKKCKNLHRHNTVQKRLDFLRKQFPVWFEKYTQDDHTCEENPPDDITHEQNSPDHTASLPSTRKGNGSNNSKNQKETRKRKFLSDDKWYHDIIEKLQHCGSEASAALCIYSELIRLKIKKDDQFPDRLKFYESYLKDDNTFDYSKLIPSNTITSQNQENTATNQALPALNTPRKPTSADTVQQDSSHDQ